MNMDKQDGQDGELKHGGITRAVIGSAFEVMKELGAGFLVLPGCRVEGFEVFAPPTASPGDDATNPSGRDTG